MSKKVQRQHFDTWINDNYPNAVAKLSIKAGVSAGSISKIRLGKVPQSQDVRRRLSQALGVTEQELFVTVD